MFYQADMIKMLVFLNIFVMFGGRDRTISRLDTGFSSNSAGIKLVLFTQTSLECEMMRAYKCFPHGSKMSNIIYS